MKCFARNAICHIALDREVVLHQLPKESDFCELPHLFVVRIFMVSACLQQGFIECADNRPFDYGQHSDQDSDTPSSSREGGKGLRNKCTYRLDDCYLTECWP